VADSQFLKLCTGEPNLYFHFIVSTMHTLRRDHAIAPTDKVNVPASQPIAPILYRPILYMRAEHNVVAQFN